MALSILPDDGESAGAARLGLIEAAMKSAFGRDTRRIAHALSVYGFARQILADVPADSLVVGAAALLHDIGIHAAELKHGSSAGRYQEEEGPPIARRLLEELGVDARISDHVCRIVGSHHSGNDIDTPEIRIIWDADWLVNIPEEFGAMDSAQRRVLIERVFRTHAGKQMALCRYG